jgi:NADH-quinone oxidoreductase subunit N
MLVVAVSAIVVLMIEAFLDRSEGLNAWVTMAGLTLAGVLALVTIGPVGTAFSGMVTTGGYAHYFAALFCLGGLLSVMLSRSYIERTEIAHGEYYALMLLAVLGMMLMAAAADLIIFFIGLELMSIPFYVLAGFIRTRVTSNEAGLKYFLLGAFATGFLLYGIALIYGAAGTTMIGGITAALTAGPPSLILLAGLGLLLIGLSFKIAAAPFHMWVPDVYEGAPTTVTAFMSTAGKAAAFAALLLIFSPALLEGVPAVREVLAVVAALSMVLGNVLALAQASVKRMLAYSSIAHAGYMLTGVVAGSDAGATGVLFYLVAYTVMNAGAFGILSMVESREGTKLSFDDYAGFSERWPVLAALMALFMFSLTGIPPFAGFFGKYTVFAAAVGAGYTWLAILGVLMSVISAYYYLRLVVLMYFRTPEEAAAPVATPLGLAALVVAALVLVQFGIFPSTLLDLTASFF